MKFFYEFNLQQDPEDPVSLSVIHHPIKDRHDKKSIKKLWSTLHGILPLSLSSLYSSAHVVTLLSSSSTHVITRHSSLFLLSPCLSHFHYCELSFSPTSLSLTIFLEPMTIEVSQYSLSLSLSESWVHALVSLCTNLKFKSLCNCNYNGPNNRAQWICFD